MKEEGPDTLFSGFSLLSIDCSNDYPDCLLEITVDATQIICYLEEEVFLIYIHKKQGQLQKEHRTLACMLPVLSFWKVAVIFI